MSDEPVQGIELVFLKQIGELGAVLLVDLHLLGLHVNLDVGLDRHKLVTEANVVPSLFKLGFLPWCQLVQMFVDLFHGAEFGDQPACSDLSYALDPGHIVGGVPADCQHVDDLPRRLDSVLLTDLLHPDDLVVKAAFARLVLPDVRLDKLSVILVRSHHIDIKPLSGAAFGHGADHIVRLEAFQHQGRDVQGFA